VQSELSPLSNRKPVDSPATENDDGNAVRSWFALSMTVWTAAVSSVDTNALLTASNWL
jgi:hypothetical protein